MPDGSAPLLHPAPSDPPWIREALDAPLVQKTRVMLAAMWFVCTKPRAFGRAWVTGEAQLPNPLFTMAAAVSVLGVAESAATQLAGQATRRSFFETLGEAAGPYFTYLVMALVAHATLRALGSQRTLRTTVGIALYTGAGPGAILALAMVTCGVVQHARGKPIDTTWVAVVISVLYGYFVYAWQRALVGAHSVSIGRGAIAVNVAIAAFALLAGGFRAGHVFDRVPVELGPHFHFFVQRGVDGALHATYGISF